MHSLFQIIILIFISFTFAEAKEPNYWRVKGVAYNGVLWIHPKPSYLSKVIGKIPYNATCLKNIKCTENLSYAEYLKLSQKKKNQLKYKTKWCKVVYNGTAGWINRNFLTKSRKCPARSKRR